MKHLLLLLVAFSFTAVAQTGGSGARTPDTCAEDMSTWTKAVKPPTKKERKTQTGQNAGDTSAASGALAGCLAAEQQDGKFILTTASAKRVEVTPDAGVDLKPHVGHQVRLTGKWGKNRGCGRQGAQARASLLYSRKSGSRRS